MSNQDPDSARIGLAPRIGILIRIEIKGWIRFRIHNTDKMMNGFWLGSESVLSLTNKKNK
jgi:hypothetical protein